MAQTPAVGVLPIQQHHVVIHMHMDSILVVDVPHTLHSLVVMDTEHVLFVIHIQANLAAQVMDITHVVQQDILIIIIHAVKPTAQQRVVLMDLLFIHIVAAPLMDIVHIKAELHVYNTINALNMYVENTEHVQCVLVMAPA